MLRSTGARWIVLCLAAACWSCSRGPGEPPRQTQLDGQRPAAQVAEVLDARIPELMASARIPGLGICLIDDVEIAWCGAFGVTDAEAGTPVRATTEFQAASLSKPVFAYAVLRLADRGVIDLDRPLVEYVGIAKARTLHLGESFDDPRIEAITARKVLSHTTGFPNWRRDNELVFLFDPGERFGYSGEGFGLLQQVVQAVTGSPLEEIVRTEVFEPLGMTRSTYTAANIDLADYAWPHDGAGRPDPRPDDIEARLAKARPHAAASLSTTATDYARFLIALAQGNGLEAATFTDLLRPQIDVDGDGRVAWGLGVGLERSTDGPVIWHWGDNGDSKAFFAIDPEDGDGFVEFANGRNGLSIVRELLEIVMPGDHPLLEGALLDDYPAFDSPEFVFISAVYTDGADAAVSLVRGMRFDRARPPVPENTINDMGYWLLGRDRVDEAIVLFELNVELYPDSWNVYDSLGEAQLEKGLRDEGLANYRKSLELNPGNRNAMRVLEQAGAGAP